MTSARIGYARCPTGKHDLAAQRAALLELAVDPDRIHTDLDLTGTNRDRLGLARDLAAVRAGDTLVVAKLDRLARSVPDAAPLAGDRRGAGGGVLRGACSSPAQNLPPDHPLGRGAAGAGAVARHHA